MNKGSSKKWFARHHAYLRSDAWKAKREEAFTYWGRACAACGQTTKLQVDHLTYQRHGTEEMRDLLVLCSWHHNEVTKARRAANVGMGDGYITITEDVLGIDLSARRGLEVGRVTSVRHLQVPTGIPCAVCGKPTNRTRKGSRCVPCRQETRRVRVS